MGSTAIAFFPWIAVDRPRTIGELRLLPYERGRQPGDLKHVSQQQIDAVLSAYANRPGNQVRHSTIVEYHDWESGMDVNNAISKLFLARDMLAFSAMAHRKLFGEPSIYSNYHNYSLVIQQYDPMNPDVFAFQTRRRDGGASQIWSSEYFAFQRPNHVPENSKMAIDVPLLESLLELDAEHPIVASIREFNSANTDSPDVPEHVEVVTLKSAFEWLFGIEENACHFIAALNARLPDSPRPDILHGPLKNNWHRSCKKQCRPLEAWAKKFCILRGQSAHGKHRKRKQLVWSQRAHLAFASMIFPLFAKKELADKSSFQMNIFDICELERIDAYVLHDPFNPEWDPATPHVWTG